MNNALVYIHIFADGTKYFGNAVRASRPFDFKNRNDKWLEAYAKFGAPVVQTKRNMTISDADALEQSLFDRYIANGGVKLQIRPRGNELSQFTKGHALTEEHKQKISKANKDREVSDETRKKLSQAHKGRKHTDEAKRNMSEAQKGNKNGVGNKGFTGKHTDEARRKISEGGKGNTNGAGNKGSKRSEETRAKMSAASKGKPKSPTAIANSTARSHRKVISMLDGRVTSAGASGRWNKKNPDYIGTWVDL